MQAGPQTSKQPAGSATPDAEFDVICKDECVASVSGPTQGAWQEAMHYAHDEWVVVRDNFGQVMLMGQGVLTNTLTVIAKKLPPGTIVRVIPPNH